MKRDLMWLTVPHDYVSSTDRLNTIAEGTIRAHPTDGVVWWMIWFLAAGVIVWVVFNLWGE